MTAAAASVLRELRQALHLSQLVFAGRLGVAQSTLSSMERGVRPIPRHVAWAAVALVPEDTRPAWAWRILDEMGRREHRWTRGEATP